MKRASEVISGLKEGSRGSRGERNKREEDGSDGDGEEDGRWMLQARKRGMKSVRREERMASFLEDQMRRRG